MFVHFDNSKNNLKYTNSGVHEHVDPNVLNPQNFVSVK